MIRHLRRANSGFILVELLTALTLFSVAGSSLYTGFVEGSKCYNRIEQSRVNYYKPKIFFMRLEQDLRNMVYLRDHPFEGNAAEISFAAQQPERDLLGNTEFKLVSIRYVKQGDKLVRFEEEISEKLKKDDRRRKTLLSGLNSFKFSFPYREPEGKLHFEEFWLDEPYEGLPRAVRTELSTGGFNAEKTVAVPHGVFGRGSAEDLIL